MHAARVNGLQVSCEQTYTNYHHLLTTSYNHPGDPEGTNERSDDRFGRLHGAGG